MNALLKILAIVLVCIILAQPSYAQPNTITLRGRILQSSGDPLTDTRLFRLRFFDSSSGGAQIGSVFDGATTLNDDGLFEISIPDSTFNTFIDSPSVFYELAIDSAAQPDGSIDAGDVFPVRSEITSVLFAQTVVNQGEGSGLDADLLDGRESSSFADADHAHDGDDLTIDFTDLNGTASDQQIPSLIARDAEIFNLVLLADGPGSILNADFLDDLNSSDFATSNHTHLITEISGIVPEPKIDDAIARDDEVFGIALDNDGSQSGLDADLLDGMDSQEFVTQDDLIDALQNLVTTPSTPDAPTELRVLKSPLGVNYRRLEWNMASTGGIENFILYEHDLPIIPSNLTMTIQHFTTTNHIDVPVTPSTGERYFRVAAFNFLGNTGPLSFEYILNTEYWFAFTADENTDSMIELFLSYPRSSASTFVVSGSLNQSKLQVTDFQFSPDNRSIAFRADINADDQFELWLSDLTSELNKNEKGFVSIEPVQLNFKVPDDSDIDEFGFSPTSREVVFIADNGDLGNDQLFVADISNGVTIDLLSNTNPRYEVADFRFTPDGRNVIYRAETDSSKGIGSEREDLFIAALDGSEKVQQLTLDLPNPASDYTIRDFIISPNGNYVAYLYAERGQSAEVLEAVSLSSEPFNNKQNKGLGFSTSDFSDNLRFNRNGNQVWITNDDNVMISYRPGPDFFSPLYSAQAWDIEEGFSITDDSTQAIWVGDFLSPGKEELFITSTANEAFPVLLSQPTLGSSRDVFDFKLSPDQQTVVFTADFSSDNDRELYVNSLTGLNSPMRISDLTAGGNGVSFDNFEFMPDGKVVIYIFSAESGPVNRIYKNETNGHASPVTLYAPRNTSTGDAYRVVTPIFGWDPIADGFRGRD